MNTTSRLVALTAVAGILASGANAQEHISLATLLTPEQLAATWPILNGKVSNPALEVEIEYMSIPSSYQALLTRQYDAVMTATAALPRLRAQGLDIKALAMTYAYSIDGEGASIWVTNDSEFDDITDLIGRSIATAGLESGGTTAVRGIIQAKYDLNPGTVGGDFDWVELPTPQMRNALKAGQIDAALIPNLEALIAAQDGAFKPILSGQREWYELHQSAMPATFIIGYEEDLNMRPEAYQAFVELLKDSIDYTLANQDEVFGAVAQEAGINAQDISAWFENFGTIPIVITEADRRSMEAVWQTSIDLGILEDVDVSADDIVWEHALTE